MRTHGLIAFAFLLIVPAAPAMAQQGQCQLFPESAESLTCSCPAGFQQSSVWGSGPYTADSNICTAALHAGVIGPEGGRVVVQRVPAPSVYRGTTSTGVTTSDWGDYDLAFMFEGAQEQVGQRACGLPEPFAVWTCVCPADAPLGSVWGSGPYTADSNICTAARHAGVLGPEGGEVTVRRTAGQQSYTGSTANGVTTSDWGSYGASLLFGPKG